MPKLSILVVEDDPLARKLIEKHLGGHTVDFAQDSGSARSKLSGGAHDICFIDLKLGEKDPTSGLALIPVAAKKGVYSVVMSGHDTDAMVEKAYSLGCDDFYAKGNEGSNVGTVLARYETKRQTGDKNSIFEDRFVTVDPATRIGIIEALKYASSELPVQLLGPSGTGKTSLARIVHDYSGRSGEFVNINCSAYTEDLLEAELFGYHKGAFTGAAEAHKGKLLAAHGGTLFLDEIGSMSLKMQTKLLKAVEEHSFYPLGADSPETSDFRIVSATHEDLQRLIKLGKLRFDFFQRIHGVTIRLKPLSERLGDVLPLIAFLTRGSRKLSFAPEAKELLLHHSWPGNVRELKKLVDLLVAGDEGLITADTLKRLFATVLQEERGGDFVSEEQYRTALQEGLNVAIERFVDGIVARNLAENAGSRRAALTDLRISTRVLYGSLKRGGKGA